MSESYIFSGGLTPCIQRTLEFEKMNAGQVNRAKKVTESVGGKQINVARLIQTLGGYARTIGFCGGDSGRKMLDLLEAENLFMEAVPTKGNTRTCQTLINRTTKSVTELVEEMSPVTEPEQHAFAEHFKKMSKDAAFITLSGTLPPSFPTDFYETLLTNLDAPVIIDSHGPALLAAIKTAPLMVKLNEHELAATVDSNNAAELVDAGAKWVLVTRSADGADLFHKNEQFHFDTPQVNVLNPIGSGDAVTAGIAFALSQNQSMHQAVAFGLACGAAQTETLIAGTLDPARVADLNAQHVL